MSGLRGHIKGTVRASALIAFPSLSVFDSTGQISDIPSETQAGRVK